ncbi:MAG: TerB family tellurite resistance protein [Bacteroidetes bacterium]|nr:TerB family tellurite resistance protein [Bacteroidota bacterium]MBS1539228.1 TerB family tellurite resistance protein [Bacteroidota bacterium]
MNGFFEHQYLSYKKNHIKNLLALAKADGFVHEKEQKMLFKIGRRYGLKDRQVKELMDSPEKFSVNVPDNFHDQMNVLYDLMLMVWADGVVEKKEIAFCEALVKKFGLKKDIVQWLLHEVFEKGHTPQADEWEELKLEAKENFVK